MTAAKDMAALWLWPWTMMQANMALFETISDVPTVIGARLPLIFSAARAPWTADVKELSRMVTEKSEGFALSSDALSKGSRVVQAAMHANAQDFGRLSGGGWFTPFDLIRMTERNLSAFAALATLPSKTLAPIHSRVTSNARRLRG